MVSRIPGFKRTQKLFDSTAPHDMNLFAAAIHSTLTPSFTKWFRLEFDEPELNQQADNRTWWDKVNELMRINLNQSNFNSEGHEVYIDLGTFGTACIYEDEKKDRGWWGGLQFQTVPIGKYAIAEGSDGKVDTLFRSYYMSAHAVHGQWPDSTPDEINWKEHPDTPFEIIHAVIPTGYRDKLAYKWQSTYILYKTRTILSDKGYFEFPFMVPRWTTYSDETYGTCNTDIALPDIRTLNKIIEMELRNLAKNVDPPLGAVQGEVIGPARMIPGGITMLKSGREGLFPIDTGGKFDVVNLKKEELRQSIHGIYLIDQLQLQNGPQMTATEVNVRYETMQRILGPHLGRLDAEWTKPLLSRTFNLMYRAGLFNPLPPALVNKLGQQSVGVRIQYEGPLARSQKSSDLTAIDQFNQSLTAMAQFDKDVVDVVDFDEIARHAADILGLPSAGVRDRDQVKQIRDEKQKMAEQQQQAEQENQAADTAHKVAPLVRQSHTKPQSGSLAEKIMQSVQGGGQ